MSLIKKYREIPFVFKMIAGLVLGVIAGLALGESASAVAPLGTLFIRLLMMAAMPLIFLNIMYAVASLNDPKLLGRIGGKIVAYYMVTTFLAASVGILAANLLHPGAHIILQGGYESAAAEAAVPSIVDTLIEMVPKNIFGALADGSLASAIVFATFFGVAIIFLRDKAAQARVVETLNVLTQIMFQIVKFVLGVAPFGVFALVANTVGAYGSALVSFLLYFLGTVALACLLMLAVYCASLALFGRKNPASFLKTVFPSIVTAFSTASSMASVPVNLDCARELGVPEKVYGFTIPLGAQINKDGLTLLLSAACVAAGQAAGGGYDMGTIFSMVLMAVLLTFGAGGVPGGSIVLITLMVETFGFPAEVAGLIAGIFAPIEMLICVPNVVGDLAGTVIVGASEKRLTKE